VRGWRWLRSDSAEAIHEEQLAEHGGPAGVRDVGALFSASARAENLAASGDPDGASLAAAYAFGVARNHPFVDGNKRTAWVLARLFLEKNGLVLRFEPSEAVVVILSLAAGDLSEEELAAWFRERISGAA
jgi:death-on-curing protein